GAHRKHGGVGTRACGRALGVRTPPVVLLPPGASSLAVRGEGMTVIAFQPKVLQLGGPWRTGELNTIVERLAAESSRGGAWRWDVGITDIGDPQFYLLGQPHDECILCISRLGGLYVLEDCSGQLLFEHNSLLALAEQARVVLQKKKTQIVARV